MNVRILCLGILTFQEASGYEIKKMVEDDVFRHFIDASYGSIYPALTKMLAEGLVSVRAEEQAGKPDKKVYTISQAGRDELARALAVDPARDKFKSEFLFQVMLSEFLPKSYIADIYEAQIEYLRDELAHIEQGTCGEGCHNLAINARGDADHQGMEFVAGYGRACLSAGLQYLEEHKREILGPTVTPLKAVKS